MDKIDTFQVIRKHMEILGCSFEKINNSNYTVHNYKTVKWREKGTKIGKVYIQELGLRIDLDFPVNVFSLEEIKGVVSLPYVDDPIKTKGSYLNCSIDKDEYDTLRIKVVNNDLKDFDFDGEIFKKLLRMVVSVNN